MNFSETYSPYQLIMKQKSRMKRFINVLAIIYFGFNFGTASAMTVGELMQMYGMGKEGETIATMHMVGIADAMLHTNAWDTVIANEMYKVSDFRGICFPKKQLINANFLMDILGTHIMETKKYKGEQAVSKVFEEDLVPVLIHILEENCPARKIRSE
jgi:hypothetical protein